MTLAEAKEEIEKRKYELLQKNVNGGYICPICNYGADDDQDGLKKDEDDDQRFTCPIGCFTSVSVIDMIGLKYNINRQDYVLREVAKELGIEVDEDKNAVKKKKSKVINKGNEDAEKNYTLFYKECLEHIDECSYLQEHGISKEVQTKFNAGYCAEWIHPETKEDVKQYIALTPRIIIPTTDTTYVAMYTGDGKGVANVQTVGQPIIFNEDILYEGDDAVFVVEDELDALSIIECGYDAVAFGNINNTKLIVDTLTKKPSNRFLVLCLDETDDDILQIITALDKELSALGQHYIVYNLVRGDMSINKQLLSNKDLLVRSIKQALVKVHRYEMERVNEYQLANSNVKYLDDFMNEQVDTPYIATGVNKLDRHLDGGMYAGFYVLNAYRSIGKTTFALQIADYIASESKITDVLIFSLEASARELITKSLSRLTALVEYKDNKNFNNAKTIRDIAVKSNYEKLSAKDKKLIANSCDYYKKFATNIYIYEGDNSTSVKQIRESIKSHLDKVRKANRKAVVIIDYLQVIASFDEVLRTDNQNMVKNIAELKRISRDYNIPILAISSMNNSDDDSLLYTGNYSEKDVLHHSSDVLLELCYRNEGKKDFNLEETISKNPIPLGVKIAKNRNGKAGTMIDFDYYPQFNLFT
ncbi:MAG: hypothetical protein E7262_07745 [Lachnospiraceae bacterium]|nr:hypothetical protein [Lachnospiraceae bacterium]